VECTVDVMQVQRACCPAVQQVQGERQRPVVARSFCSH